jgi:hypothetical protein
MSAKGSNRTFAAITPKFGKGPNLLTKSLRSVPVSNGFLD